MTSLKIRILEALQSASLARRIYYFDEIGSTSDWARAFIEKNGEDGDLHGTVVIAEHQTAGRGRFKRNWQSAPGRSLLVSLIIQPGKVSAAEDVIDKSPIAMITCAAVCEAIRETSGIDTRIKYPNDVTCEGRKLSGILIEQVSAFGRIYQVLGIGVNVNQVKEELPRDTRTPASSIKIESGREMDISELLKHILTRLEAGLSLPPDKALEKLNLLCDTIGKVIEVTEQYETITGTAMALEADGALLLRTEGGGMIRITSGEIVQVIPNA